MPPFDISCHLLSKGYELLKSIAAARPTYQLLKSERKQIAINVVRIPGCLSETFFIVFQFYSLQVTRNIQCLEVIDSSFLIRLTFAIEEMENHMEIS